MSGYNSKDCKSCHKFITDGQAYKLGSDQWHVSCFKCSKCSKELGVNSNFLVLGTGALVCSDCSYTCKSCEKKIYDLAILTGDLAYCADCFKCKSCNKPIDDLKYARTSKGLFCMPCHNMLMEKKKKYERMKKLKASKEESQKKLEEMKKLHKKNDDNNKINNLNEKGSHKIETESLNNLKDSNSGLTTLPINIEPIEGKKDVNLSTISKPPAYQGEMNTSSTSTFDVDDYAESNESQLEKDEIASSVYSKQDEINSEKIEKNDSIDNELKKVDSSPIEKLDVFMDYELKSPKTETVQSTPVFPERSSVATIPVLKPDTNNDTLNYFHQDHAPSDISIPLRSPRRYALSPVRNTTQFRTPELDSPKKKANPVDLMSPQSLNRRAFVIEPNEADAGIEKEPESFINLDDETEEESMMSNAEGNEANAISSPHLSALNDPNQAKLMSPMRYNTSSFDSIEENIGLNIKGLASQNVSSIVNSTPSQLIERDPPHENTIMHTPEQTIDGFDVSDRNTPNSKKKQIGGLGRSLTKVFGRGRKYSNDSKDHTTEPPTPETITKVRASSSINNKSPRGHVRTQSDHSFVAFSTPPIPVGAGYSHTRSISETITPDVNDRVLGGERELKYLKTEINALTLSKATILRDIQNLKSQLNSLELDVAERQKTLKDLDLMIQNKRKLSLTTTDEISLSNKSTSSGKNSFRDEYASARGISNENLMQQETIPSSLPAQSSLAPALGPPPMISSVPISTPPSTSSLSGSIAYNPYHQPSSSSASKDKRTGFMRRIFGTHSTLNSASSGQSNISSAPMSTPTISQPMNVRHNDDHPMNFGDVSNIKVGNNLPDNIPHTTGMKQSRSANFIQWRTNNSDNNHNNNAKNVILGDSNDKNIYNMTLQEVSDYEENNGVPYLVKTCIFEIEHRGSKVEGIYRISASTSTVEKIEQFFETLDINNSSEIANMHSLIDGDIHALAGLLKRYLKRIPDSIIPQDAYNSYVNVSTLDNDQARIATLKEIVSSLPRANRQTLFALTKHLAVIAENEKWTKMNCGSLATVFAPTLVRHNSLHPHQEIQDNKAKTLVTELLFKNYKVIFDNK